MDFFFVILVQWSNGYPIFKYFDSLLHIDELLWFF